MVCVCQWFINTCMAGAATLPGMAWSGHQYHIHPCLDLIGLAFSGIGIFLFRLAKVDVTGLSLWQKADVGLALAVVFKPALGIAF